MLHDRPVGWLETRRSCAIRRIRPCAACGAAAILLLAARGATAFRATLPGRWTSHGASSPATGQHYSGMPRARYGRNRWALKSSETESRGSGEGGRGSVGSDEDNNWGMDDSIDVDAIRTKMMEKAGYAKREDSDAGEEWTTVDEDGSDGAVAKMKDMIAGSLSSELLGKDSFKDADASQLVEELLDDTDMAKFFDEEFEKGTSALRALADELKTEQGTSSYADTMAQELAELFQAEEEKAAEEIAARRGPAKAKLDKATAELEGAMADAQDARRAFEGDILLQLLSFRKKGVLRQAAFVAAVLISNQAVYQAILVADDRGGSPAFVLGGLVTSAALVWVYGYRPFSL